MDLRASAWHGELYTFNYVEPNEDEEEFWETEFACAASDVLYINAYTLFEYISDCERVI